MTTTRARKHPCPDCRQCQHCSETRCRLCRGQGSEAAGRRFADLSLQEQIDLFEAINRGQAAEGDYGQGRKKACRDAGYMKHNSNDNKLR